MKIEKYESKPFFADIDLRKSVTKFLDIDFFIP